LPTSASTLQLAISVRAAKSLRAGHPWVYRSEIVEGAELPHGGLVHLVDQRGKFIASALTSSSSEISLRVISLEPLKEKALASLLAERVAMAAQYRSPLVQDSQAYRVVFSEADQIPGLVVDRYADVFVVQFLTQAMDREDLRAAVLQALLDAFGKNISIFERVDARIRKLEALPELQPRLLHGERSSTTFEMNGLKFHFDAATGQKTGAFLDQRENYVAAAKYAHGEALDVFTYHGGFALHLARVCTQVTGVDVSRAALEQAEKNAELNSGSFKVREIEWLEADAFELLKDYASGGKLYDTIVLDPPAFAKNKRSLDKALTGYKEINLRALKMLRPGGLLITNSCSHHVSESDFVTTLASAAANAGRTVKILEKRTQAQDHPIVATIPETGYLKCLICHVN
jgi:23S rRNA (cytosine1962-C5)-methyltransferase